MTTIKSRKADHIRINLEQDVQSGLDNGLAQFRFLHNALPEVDLKDIDTKVRCFGRNLSFPLLISSMTGGTDSAELINQRLARVAHSHNIAMGVGSQRVSMGGKGSAKGFDVRKFAPDILLFANIGAVQLNYGYSTDDCRKLVDSISADALFLHLNPLQEALQPEGDTNFAGLLRKIETLASDLEQPIVVKEVGWGISGETAKALLNAGVAGIDVAGSGGTSWSQVELNRIQDPVIRETAAAFRNWGIPTVDALLQVKKEIGNGLLIGSGGLATGMDVAKMLALGADLCGIAGPFLRAAHESEEAIDNLISEIKSIVRFAMFATGSKSLHEFRERKIRRVNNEPE